MTVERMNEQISRWKSQKEAYDEQMEKKISDMEKERDLAVAAATQKIFARHHLSIDELVKLKHANKQQLQKLLKYIDEEITEPAAPAEEEPDIKNEKEIKENAKELNT